MAKFEVQAAQGMQFVKVTIENEMIQAEAGALCWMTGNIVMDAKLPFIGRMVKSYLSEESAVRPTYTGTGTIYLESSFGGFHVIDLEDESWILQSGAYLASDASIKVGVHREKMWTSFWAGEGFIDWQTKVGGRGKVVLASEGPIDEITLEKGQQLVTNGRYVVARTPDVSYRIQRVARSRLASRLSRQGYCRFYEGPGRLLLSSVPYWRYRMFNDRSVQQM